MENSFYNDSWTINFYGGLSVEPRIQEYLRQKAYYKERNIEPSISLERRYMITQDDMKIIRNIRSKPESEEKIINNQQTFPSSKFKEDPRVPKIIKDDRCKKVPNMGTFAIDKCNDKYYEVSNSTVNRMLGDRDLSEYSTCRRKVENKCISTNSHVKQYNDDNEKLYAMCNCDISKFNRRGIPSKLLSDCNDLRQSRLDTETKMVIPDIKDTKRDLNTCKYTSMIGDGDINNVDLETELRGNATRNCYGRKYNYVSNRINGRMLYDTDQVFEHHFDFISDDVQDPDHIVNENPVSTRMDNHRIAKTYKREWM